MEEVEGEKKQKEKKGTWFLSDAHTHTRTYTYAQPSASYERRGDMRLHRAALVPPMFVTCYVLFGKHPV